MILSSLEKNIYWESWGNEPGNINIPLAKPQGVMAWGKINVSQSFQFISMAVNRLERLGRSHQQSRRTVQAISNI